MLKIHWGWKVQKVYTIPDPKKKKNWGRKGWSRKSWGRIDYIPYFAEQ